MEISIELSRMYLESVGSGSSQGLVPAKSCCLLPDYGLMAVLPSCRLLTDRPRERRLLSFHASKRHNLIFLRIPFSDLMYTGRLPIITFPKGVTRLPLTHQNLPLR